MRILGIDPGLQTTGFGVIDVSGSQLTYVASGVIRTDKVKQGNLPNRLRVIYDGILEINQRYQPESACVTALVSCNLEVAEYTALQMKKAITGHGRAAKSQIQEMVKRMLKLPSVPGPDAADALGLAITHAHASPSMNKLAALDVLNRKTHGMYRGGRSH